MNYFRYKQFNEEKVYYKWRIDKTYIEISEQPH